MLSAIKKLFATKSDESRGFSGTGIVLMAEAREFASLSKGLSPMTLADHLNRLTSALINVVETHGGVVHMHAGGSLVSYWPPEKTPACAQQVIAAAEEMQALGQDVTVSVALGELALTNVGSAAKRPVLLGAAYERAEKSLLAARCGIIEADALTLDALPQDLRTRFAARDDITEIR